MFVIEKMKGWLWKRMKTASQQPPFSFHQNNQEVKIGSRGCSFYFLIKQNSPTTSHSKESKQYLLFPFFLMLFFFSSPSSTSLALSLPQSKLLEHCLVWVFFLSYFTCSTRTLESILNFSYILISFLAHNFLLFFFFVWARLLISLPIRLHWFSAVFLLSVNVTPQWWHGTN